MNPFITESLPVIVQVNGEPMEVQENSTVRDLVAKLALRAEEVAVEVNLEVIPRAEHGQRGLRAGDQVEVVTFVGGG